MNAPAPAQKPRTGPDSRQSQSDIRKRLAKMSGSMKVKLVVEALELDKARSQGQSDHGKGGKSIPGQGGTNDALILGLLEEFKQDLDRQQAGKLAKPKARLPGFLQNPDGKTKLEPNQPKRAGKTTGSDFTVSQFNKEHPSIVALVLSGVPTARAAILLRQMHPRRAQKTALILSEIETRRQETPNQARSIVERLITR